MGIKAICNKCGKEIEFPNCPNAKTDKHENLVFSIYSLIGNESADKKWSCVRCIHKT